MTGRGLWKAAGLLAALVLIAVAALLSLSPSQRGPDFDGPLAPRAFSLGGERFTMDLPAQAAISEDRGGAFAWIELNPRGRSSPNV